MTNEPPPYENQTDALPNAADAERDLVGAVLYDPEAFKKARLKSSDFYVHRWKWVWEACEAIQVDGDNPDYETIRKYLVKSGHWEDVNAREPLEATYNSNTLHVEANARLVREMACAAGQSYSTWSKPGRRVT